VSSDEKGDAANERKRGEKRSCYKGDLRESGDREGQSKSLERFSLL
jgi:hypothetical protein